MRKNVIYIGSIFFIFMLYSYCRIGGIMKSKVNKGLLITVIVLVLVIGLLVFKLTRDTVSTNKDKNTTSDNNTQVIDKVEGAKDFDLKEAEQLLDKFGFNEDLGCNQYIYFSKYSDTFKKIIAFKNVDQSKITKKKCSEIYPESKLDEFGRYLTDNGVCEKDKERNIISYEEANKTYKEMFGIDMSKSGVNTGKAQIGNIYYHFYDYVDSLDSFVELECGGCGGACNAPESSNVSITMKKIISAKSLNDSLVIDFIDFRGEIVVTGGENRISLGRLGSISVSSNDEESAKKEIEEKYLDKLDVYEVVFTKKDGNYIFKSLTKKLS